MAEFIGFVGCRPNEKKKILSHVIFIEYIIDKNYNTCIKWK